MEQKSPTRVASKAGGHWGARPGGHFGGGGRGRGGWNVVGWEGRDAGGGAPLCPSWRDAIGSPTRHREARGQPDRHQKQRKTRSGLGGAVEREGGTASFVPVEREWRLGGVLLIRGDEEKEVARKNERGRQGLSSREGISSTAPERPRPPSLSSMGSGGAVPPERQCLPLQAQIKALLHSAVEREG